MKKITLLLVILLGVVGTQAQVEYVAYQPAAPVAVDWNGGNQPSYNGSYFKVSNGDVIKVHVTNASSTKYDPKVVLRGTDGSGWNAKDVVTTTDGEFTYTVASDDEATSINNYGIVLTGEGYSMLDITVRTNNVTSASQTLLSNQNTDLGNWGKEVSLASYDFSTTKVGDVINITYTSYNTLAEGAWATIHLQSNTAYDGVTAWSAITDACSKGTQSANTQETLSIIVDDLILTALQKGYAMIRGGNVYLNSLTISSFNHIHTKTIMSDDCDFGNWGPYYSINDGKYFTSAKTGDILSIAYSVSEGNSGELQLIDTSNGWQKYSDSYAVSGLSGTGTTNFIIDADLLAKLQGGEIVIKGAGNNTGKGVSLKTFFTKAGYRPVYIPASGYATFYATSTCALPDGMKVYYAAADKVSSDKVVLTQIDNIPDKQGVILNGSEGIYQIYTTTAAPASVNNNKLVGATTRTDITNKLAGSAYMLYNNGGTPEFRKMAVNTKLDAYKCYLNTEGTSADPGARLNIVFDDSETTGINAAAMNKVAQDNAYYTLSGQRVAQPTKGLYIVNGKKVIIK